VYPCINAVQFSEERRSENIAGLSLGKQSNSLQGDDPVCVPGGEMNIMQHRNDDRAACSDLLDQPEEEVLVAYVEKCGGLVKQQVPGAPGLMSDDLRIDACKVYHLTFTAGKRQRVASTSRSVTAKMGSWLLG
jgi:hypothetical protein